MKLIFIIISALLISGCGSKEVIKYVDKPVFVKTEIKSDLLKKCSVSQPPDKEDYLKSDYKKKESLLTDHILVLHSDINKCNNQINKIKETINEHNDLIERKNNEK